MFLVQVGEGSLCTKQRGCRSLGCCSAAALGGMELSQSGISSETALQEVMCAQPFPGATRNMFTDLFLNTGDSCREPIPYHCPVHYSHTGTELLALGSTSTWVAGGTEGD